MKIYTDASIDDRNQIAGIGIIIQDGLQRKVFSTWMRARTINEAELFAIHLALILSEGKGTIYTDSQTAISYIKDEIKDKPRNLQQYINHKHCEYWAKQIRNRGIYPEKIKGHQKVFQVHAYGNKMADVLAGEGRAKYYESLREAKRMM